MKKPPKQDKPKQNGCALKTVLFYLFLIAIFGSCAKQFVLSSTGDGYPKAPTPWDVLDTLPLSLSSSSPRKTVFTANKQVSIDILSDWTDNPNRTSELTDGELQYVAANVLSYIYLKCEDDDRASVKRIMNLSPEAWEEYTLQGRSDSVMVSSSLERIEDNDLYLSLMKFPNEHRGKTWDLFMFHTRYKVGNQYCLVDYTYGNIGPDRTAPPKNTGAHKAELLRILASAKLTED